MTGLRARAHHGVYAHERADGQHFGADVTFEIPTAAAAASDDVADTLSYGEVARTARAILGGEPVDLLETLAERIARAVLDLGAAAVEVTIHKPEAPVGVEVDDVTLTIRRERGAVDDVADRALHAVPAAPTTVVLALGANQPGDLATPADQLRRAADSLAHAGGLHVTAVSPLVSSAAALAPGQEPQPDYVNAVVLATTTLSPAGVLALARWCEEAAGRVRTERWAPRTLDVDVIAVGDLVSDDPALTLPHPRAADRAFVLVPWSLVDPGAELPGAGRVADLAERALDRDGVRDVEGWTP
ncbi:2-amino-4-hydroxy-6-hydroxymethyldihydropteridine diphosphokinase [Georgenia sp. Z1491]|uniref:2-amino-4-hydroxy-6- hydroxymethyldihydropteridine diphosphokinase n=1 Tax=Georgenia sp. Z1491 TaxID=3416707 RepID=UPI003CEADBF0